MSLVKLDNKIKNVNTTECIKKNIKHHITYGKGETSTTVILPFIFIKYIIRSVYLDDHDVYEREKYIASILAQFDWFPPLLYSDDKQKILIYKNVGTVLTQTNSPSNLKQQFNTILNDLKSVNIQHNDIKIGELLINSNQKIFLCDFGWGSVNNNLDCGIGIWACDKINKPGGYYNDEDTLKRLQLV